MKRILKWPLRILAGLLALLLVAAIVFMMRDSILYSDFYKHSERGWRVPGLWSGYVSQGFDYCEERGVFLTCGYQKAGRASRIYILDGEEEIRVDLKYADGSDYAEHTGGIDTYGSYVYITGTDGCDLFLLDDVLDGDGRATMVDQIKTINDPAYCTIRGDTLYTGSYYDPGKYETPSEQHMTTPSGEQNTSILSVYALDPATGKPYSETPNLIYSTTSHAQGMCFIGNDVLVLSCSYGLSTSLLHFYDLAALPTETATMRVGEHDVVVAFLDSTSLIETVEAPPMSEEIVWHGDRLWVLSESACTKYWFGKLTSGNRIHGLALPTRVAARVY